MPALLGAYQLIERIGTGGMAEVFLGLRRGARGGERPVALKRILPHLAGRPEVVARFVDEARIAAQLDHPHIVRVYDFGVDGGTHYIAMEHVAGQELGGLIRRSVELGRPLALDEAAWLVWAACEALDHAHERGILHRDVTPSNLLVSYDGVVKLTDFGIARPARAPTGGSGFIEGKVAYMSPEQASGQPLDRRADVYSLGVCAWELITGRRRFTAGDELTLLGRVRAGRAAPIASLRAVPARLAAALERALAADPEARHPSARAFGEALWTWLASIGAALSPPRLASTMARYFGSEAARRRPAPPSEPTVRRPTLLGRAARAQGV
jgi:serine/threonine-protein kinase